MVENKYKMTDELKNEQNANKTEFSQTPDEYEKIRKERMNLDIADEIKKVEMQKEKFNKYSLPIKVSKRSYIKDAFYSLIAGFIPVFIVIFIIIAIMVEMKVAIVYDAEFITLIKWNATLSIIICVICGVFLCYSDNIIVERRNNDYIRALDVYENLKKDYEIQNKNLEQKCRTISQIAENDCSVYKENYEAYIRTLSADLSESKLVLKITDWLTKEFINIINNVDRRNNVQQIKVPFLFYIYCNKVTSSIGEFDFDIERYEKLDSKMKIEAVSKVIATQVQLNIISKFQKDISGTDVNVHLEFKYHDGDISCKDIKNSYKVENCITYNADNGNFKKEQSWL